MKTYFQTLQAKSGVKNKLTIFTLLLSASVNAQDNIASLEDSAYAVIEKIPEIAALIKSDTDKIWHFSMRTIKRPNTDFKYYWIQAGKVNEVRFFTQFNFYVDPKSFEVLYLDTRTNKTITLDELRKLEKASH